MLLDHDVQEAVWGLPSESSVLFSMSKNVFRPWDIIMAKGASEGDSDNPLKL